MRIVNYGNRYVVEDGLQVPYWHFDLEGVVGYLMNRALNLDYNYQHDVLGYPIDEFGDIIFND